MMMRYTNGRIYFTLQHVVLLGEPGRLLRQSLGDVLPGDSGTYARQEV